jgi:flagellar protein FlaE
MAVSIRNVVESIMGGDEPSEPEAPESANGDGDEFGGMDDDGDALGGFDGDGDEFGSGDDGDGFGDMAGGDGGQVDELEHRIDEIETELDDLSSTVETVRTENEQISASVADVEENVRKLLDIYEMVTNGVNPFADDVDAGAAGGSMGGDFGLFDDEGGDDGADDGIDEDVAEADPEGFFDEDLDEDDLTVDDEPAVDDVFGNEADEPAEPANTDGGGSPPADAGTSFEDLKEEYDSGDDVDESDAQPTQDTDVPSDGSTPEPDTDAAGPDDGQPNGDGGPSEPSTPDSEPGQDSTEQRPGRAASDPDATPRADDPGSSAGSVPTPASNGAGDGATHERSADRPRTNGGGHGTAPRSAAVDRSPARDDAAARPAKPYLSSVPGGYATDLVVTEWLEFMVSKAGVREAARALEYYESIGWLAPAATERLEDRLGGFDGGGTGTLDTEDHERSLQYVSQLTDSGGAAVGRATLPDGGGSDGVQR